MDRFFGTLKPSESVVDRDGDDMRHYLFDMLSQMSQIAAKIGEDDLAGLLRQIVDARKATTYFGETLHPN